MPSGDKYFHFFCEIRYYKQHKNGSKEPVPGGSFSEGRVVIVLVTWDTRGFSRAFVAVPVWKDNVNVTSRIIVKMAHIVGGSHLGV